ncbi:hypothetical protein MHYP_G00345050 [Metynnis hypsauchen]
MMVLEPPEELTRRLQKKVVYFFWSAQHWTRAAVVFLPVEEGGQGLVDIQSRSGRWFFEVSRWILEEPLLHNPLIQTRLLSSASVRACLLRKGCTKLEHRMDVNGWKSPVEPVLRVIERQQAGALSAPGLEVTLAIQVDPGEERVSPGTLLHIPDLGPFQMLSRKALYHACVKVAHQTGLKHQRVIRWLELFGPDFLLRDRWRSLYKPPIEKLLANLQCRIIHGAIATERHVAHLNPSVGGSVDSVVRMNQLSICFCAVTG